MNIIDYVGPVVAFLATVAALGGDKLDKTKTGLRRVTKYGWAAVILAVVGVGVSLEGVHRRQQSAARAEIRAREASEKLSAAVLNTELANRKADSLNLRLATYATVLDILRTRSERTIEQVMTSFVDLSRSRTWTAPNANYAGSVVKLYGFYCDVWVSYGGREELLRRDAPVREAMLIGSPGVPMRWSLRSDRACDGKVQVTSSPRGRSLDWSWVEERLNAPANVVSSVTPAGSARRP